MIGMAVMMCVCVVFSVLTGVLAWFLTRPPATTDTIPPNTNNKPGSGTGNETTSAPVADGTWQCVQSYDDKCSWLKVKKTGGTVVCAGPNTSGCDWSTSKSECESKGSTDGLKCTQTTGGWCKDALTVLNGGTTDCTGSGQSGGGGRVEADGWIHVGADGSGKARIEFDTWQIYADGDTLAFISRASGDGLAFRPQTKEKTPNWIPAGHKDNFPSWIALENWALACGSDSFVIQRKSDKKYWELKTGTKWTENIKDGTNEIASSKAKGIALANFWKIDGGSPDNIYLTHVGSRKSYSLMDRQWV